MHLPKKYAPASNVSMISKYKETQISDYSMLTDLLRMVHTVCGSDLAPATQFAGG